jgi:hypothetical protein
MDQKLILTGATFTGATHRPIYQTVQAMKQMQQ